MERVLEHILSNTYTKHDFYYRINMLQEYLERVFYNNDDADDSKQLVSVIGLVRMDKEEDLERIFTEWGETVFSFFNAGNLYKTVSDLKAAFDNLEEVVVSVPHLFDDQDSAYVGKWVRANLSTLSTLVLAVDEDVVGGCVITWRGERHDFSFRGRFDEKRDEIRELIHTYDGGTR